MKVVWTDTAKGNLRRIHDYIAQTSPAYAKRMIDRLTNRSKQIGTFPLAGRVVPEFNYGQIREVFEDSYRIIYHIRPESIELIRRGAHVPKNLIAIVTYEEFPNVSRIHHRRLEGSSRRPNCRSPANPCG